MNLNYLMINACNVVYRSPHMSNMITTSLSNSYFIRHFLFSTNTFPQKARQISGYENRKYPPFPSLSYFSEVVCLRWLSYHILSSIPYISRGHWDLVSITGVQSMVFQMIGYIGRVRLFADYNISYQYYADLSEGIELLKCLGIWFRVCV